MCFFLVYGDHRDLHVLTHSFPPRRSSDLPAAHGDAKAPYGVVTLHRPANVDTRTALRRIVEALAASAVHLPLLFPVHPRTAASLERFGLTERSEEHTSELQSLMRISYAVFCLKKKKRHHMYEHTTI